ncbi:thioredoxin-like protein [Flavobacteriaceae bacterium MAR_2010_105]|nr:thioredoxin-like protein [Flavobacteriaceae bacterium MAR_2010_105]
MKSILCFILLLPAVIFGQHQISGVFSPASDYTYVLLYQATPNGTNYMNKGEVKSDGSFSIMLDATVIPGMYKLVYALPPEDYNFDFIYNGKENIALTFDTEKGLEFTESNENKLWSSYTKSMALVNTAIGNFYSKESADENAFKDIFKTLKETQEAYEKASMGTMASTFIRANKPYIPEAYEDISTYSTHLKKTYFDNVDFSNSLLQSSDFLADRVMAYVFGMTLSANNDGYKKDIDTLVRAMEKSHGSVKITLLQMVWQRFTELENETMANYITNNYLLDLAKQMKYEQLVEVLESYKNNSIGNKAQDFEIPDLNNEGTTTLYNLNTAQRYLVIFWSSSCSHCLDELPKVRALVPKNTQVIAIGLEDESENWQKEIKNYPNFIHILGLEKWNNTIVKAYNVNATPTYMLLDKNKTIIAKPYDLEALTLALKQ